MDVTFLLNKHAACLNVHRISFFFLDTAIWQFLYDFDRQRQCQTENLWSKYWQMCHISVRVFYKIINNSVCCKQCDWIIHGAFLNTISFACFSPHHPQQSPSSRLYLHWAPYWIESSRINFNWIPPSSWYTTWALKEVGNQAKKCLSVCACAQLYMFGSSRESSKWCHSAMFTWLQSGRGLI